MKSWFKKSDKKSQDPKVSDLLIRIEKLETYRHNSLHLFTTLLRRIQELENKNQKEK